eukprot:1635087-Pyramimonas_sp.AAC.1
MRPQRCCDCWCVVAAVALHNGRSPERPRAKMAATGMGGGGVEEEDEMGSSAFRRTLAPPSPSEGLPQRLGGTRNPTARPTSAASTFPRGRVEQVDEDRSSSDDGGQR